MVGISSRTLRRRLNGLGVSYSAMVENTRFRVARRLLTESEVKLVDITYAVGYSDPSHFTRAFRRISGLTPSAFRRSFH